MTETKTNYDAHPNTDTGDIGDYETTWRAQYQRYLRSPEWRDKRERVLRRDGYQCQSCLGVPATQIHHLPGSYKYGRYCPLFLLVSVCDHCHDEISAIDRGELRPWDFSTADVHEELNY